MRKKKFQSTCFRLDCYLWNWSTCANKRTDHRSHNILLIAFAAGTWWAKANVCMSLCTQFWIVDIIFKANCFGWRVWSERVKESFNSFLIICVCVTRESLSSRCESDVCFSGGARVPRQHHHSIFRFMYFSSIFHSLPSHAWF